MDSSNVKQAVLNVIFNIYLQDFPQSPKINVFNCTEDH